MGMLGHRRAGALEVFAAGGAPLPGSFPVAVDAALGIVIHGLWMLLWAVLLVSVARHGRGLGAMLLAVVVAALAFAISGAAIVPGGLLGPLATLTPGERALVHLVLATSLILGLRLALRGDGQGSQ